MASSTVTVDTNEWVYIDSFGIGHTITNAQTFTLTVTDGGVSAVEYSIPLSQEMTTTDGYLVNFRPEVDINGTGRTIHFLTDAGEGSDTYHLEGELVMECPTSGRIQRWRMDTMDTSDADFGSAGTIGFTAEDQFGNRMSITGVSVGQAA
jgi:hypothetical protein